MSGYQLGQKPATCNGIDLTRPVDRSAPGKWPSLSNVVAVIDGTVTPRPGLGVTALITCSTGANRTPAHSIGHLSDPANGFARVVGAATGVLHVQYPATTQILLDTGYSGDPLALVQARPTESPQPWMFIADRLRMRKVNWAGTLHQIGLPSSDAAPSVISASGFYQTVDLLRATSTWAASGGGAGVPTLALLAGANVPVNTTTTAFTLETFAGSYVPSMVCIRPASMSGIVVGEIVNVAKTVGTEDVRVLETHSGTAAIAISGIKYVGGGFASVVLATPNNNIQVNSMVQFVQGGTNEYTRVQAVQYGPDGSSSITVKLVNTYTAGTVQAFPSFMAVFESTLSGLFSPALGGAITNGGLRFTITGATSPAVPALFSKTGLTLDLTTITSVGGITKAVAPDDYMSLVIRTDNPALLSEISVMLDCGDGTFTQNYYSHSIRSSDLTPLLKFAQTALANRQDQIQKRHIDTPPVRLPGGLQPIRRQVGGGIDDRQPPAVFFDPRGGDVTTPGSEITGPSGDQLAPGDSQFFAVQFKLSDMQRNGTDESVGWRNINGLRLAIQNTATINVDVTSWTVQGGFAPEVGEIDEGYTYRVRGRVSSTGVCSNYGPESIGPVRAIRGSIGVTLTQHSSTECDKLDIERHGGGVPGWRLIQTIENSATPVFLDTIDNLSADAAFEDDLSGLTSFQLWPTVQKPQTGTANSATGTLLVGPASTWSTSLARGIPVIAGGFQATLRRTLPQGGDAAGTASILEVYENLGQITSPKWELPRPVYLAQPLPVYALWQDSAGNTRGIGLGDPANPSAFYLTKDGDPDSTLESLHYEIEGQVLQNVLVYNSTPFILTTEGLYRVDPAGVGDDGKLILRVTRIPGSRGLYARWACCSGDMMYWLSREGIIASDGGRCVSVTDDDLYPLFPHGGVDGVAVNGLNPVRLTVESDSRLSYGDGRLFFDYTDSGANRRTLELRIRGEQSGWYPHLYTPPAQVHYYEDGPLVHNWLVGTDSSDSPSRVCKLTDAQSDLGTAINYSAQTPYENFGDPRKRKRLGDYTVEAATDTSTIVITPGLDNGTTTLATVNMSGAGLTRQISIKDVLTGKGVLAVNVGLLFSGTVTTQRPIVYGWEPTWLDRPEVTLLRGTDFEDLDTPGLKFGQAIRFFCDTLGTSRTVDIEVDGQATTVQTVTGIASGNDGPTWVTKSLNPPVLFRTIRLRPTDAGSWQLFKTFIVWEPEPELETHYETQQTTHDIDEAYKVVRDGLITLRSFSVVTLTIKRAEDGATLYSVAIPSTAGLRKPVYLPVADIKARALIYIADSTAGFALYRSDTWFRVRGWGKTVRSLGGSVSAGWLTVMPFGDEHRRVGARA